MVPAITNKKITTAGDDLDDGLDYSFDGTGDAAEVVLAGSDEEDLDLVEGVVTLEKTAKKRKSSEDGEEDLKEENVETKERASKKKKTGKLAQKVRLLGLSTMDDFANKMAFLEKGKVRVALRCQVESGGP